MTPIVLLHGALDGPHAWDGVARLLRQAGREVVVHDARALTSPRREPAPADAREPPPLVDPREVAEAVAPLLPAHLVGHSRGGTSAGWLAAEHGASVASLCIVASPPQASEAFRATFRRALERAPPADRETLAYLASMPEDAFPTMELRRYRGRALVVEYEDDPLYSPTHTLFWRMYLPYADFERKPGGHRAFAEDSAACEWLAGRILAHVRASERHLNALRDEV